MSASDKGKSTVDQTATQIGDSNVDGSGSSGLSDSSGSSGSGSLIATLTTNNSGSTNSTGISGTDTFSAIQLQQLAQMINLLLDQRNQVPKQRISGSNQPPNQVVTPAT